MAGNAAGGFTKTVRRGHASRMRDREPRCGCPRQLAGHRGAKSRGARNDSHRLPPSGTRIAAQPVSPLDEAAMDEGLAGARLGVADNATTGRFIGQSYALIERRVIAEDDPAAAAAALAAEGVRFVVADLDAEPLRAAAGASASVLFFNARAPDDALRAECRPNLLHTIPSRAMLADGLAQYLVWKRWRRFFLVVGPEPDDLLYAESARSVAKWARSSSSRYPACRGNRCRRSASRSPATGAPMWRSGRPTGSRRSARSGSP
jgi:hypothetical protein